MEKTLRMGRQVAQVLGVSVPTARRIAREDPTFPPVFRPTPRVSLVSEAALRLFVESKRINAHSGEGKQA